MPQRQIDQLPAPPPEKQKPIRVLVLGLPRTGTSPLVLALRHLGYTPHTMRAVLSNPTHLALWQEAIDLTLVPRSQLSSSKKDLLPYTKSDFDVLLSGYDVVADIPGAIFGRELVEAYPDAKVILTRRKYEEWEESMNNSIGVLLTWKLFIFCRQLNITQMAPLTRLMHSVFRVHSGNVYSGPKSKAAYEKHYDTIRSIVPKERLLDVDVADLSYNSLCRFLDVEKPQTLNEFPRIEEDKGMRRGLEAAWLSVVQFLMVVVLFPIVSLSVAAWIYMRPNEADAAWRFVKDRVDTLFLQGNATNVENMTADGTAGKSEL